jgi:hypothetical protein
MSNDVGEENFNSAVVLFDSVRSHRRRIIIGNDEVLNRVDTKESEKAKAPHRSTCTSINKHCNISPKQ